MIEMMEAFLLFFGGFIGGVFACWAGLVMPKKNEGVNDDQKTTDAGKTEITEIVALVDIMKDNRLEKLELYDGGFKIKRWMG